MMGKFDIRKKAAIAALALSAGWAVGAAEVRLAWGPSATTHCTYRVYAFTNDPAGTFPWSASPAPVARINAGTNLTATVDQVAPGLYWFAATAISQDGLESEYNRPLAAESPAPPGDMRMVVLEYSGTLTNWTGFLRLRIP